MNRVRYKIGDNGFLNLAHVIEQGGFASAVTLIDVVIFRGPTEANDPSIWAHELTHVDQYQEWGVHSFAIQYARDYNGVENPAYGRGNGYWAWAQQRGGPTQVAFPRHLLLPHRSRGSVHFVMSPVADLDRDLSSRSARSASSILLRDHYTGRSVRRPDLTSIDFSEFQLMEA
jgi:hypothetical protein